MMRRGPADRVLIAACALTLAHGVGGCGSASITNPAFPLQPEKARSFLGSLRDDPVVLERPLLILAGYQDPGFGVRSVAKRLRRRIVNPELIVPVEFLASPDFDAARDRVIGRLETAFPSPDPGWTREVDVIGISMGGLVARHAAREVPAGGKRLKIARLFTIATPHRGAILADLPTLDRKQIDMRRGSSFLADLNEDATSRDFEIISYVRLDDSIVGVENAAPPGEQPWWISNLPMKLAHINSPSDPRIMADILRRLIGAQPFTKSEPIPPP